MNPAERALRNSGHIRILNEQGLEVIPKALMDELRNVEEENILIIEGRAIVIKLASPNDVDRISRSMQKMR